LALVSPLESMATFLRRLNPGQKVSKSAET